MARTVHRFRRLRTAWSFTARTLALSRSAGVAGRTSAGAAYRRAAVEQAGESTTDELGPPAPLLARLYPQ
ncbi:hypothetical protein RB628_05565 [Streptomyces sp. ADMS]|uniref:hypothetical protein n=1 Tax=Streptomyces sp. ADMS TaxID=3071415 RepID=UPI00296EDC80|nr:hypothetical protein [Streptomyces sp. ADMS]MDW4904826.1 hypothetical protein [Streptomyces sp. ADMS]